MKISTITAVLLVFVVITAGAFALLGLRQTVTIDVDGQSQSSVVWGWTVEDALANAGIPVTEGDVIIPKLEERLSQEHTIRIDRAFWALVTADGKTQRLWTTERHPEQLLIMAGVELGPADQLLWNGRSIDPKEGLSRAGSYSLQIQRAAQIEAKTEGQDQQIISTGATLGEALWEEDVLLHDGDQLEPAFETPLQGQPISVELGRGRQITIQEATKTLQARVLAENVGEALAQAGVSLQGLDYSIPSEQQPIPASNIIQVVRVREEISLETEPLDFGFLTQPLEDAELDTQKVVQVGEYGLTARRVRVVYEDGVEVARQTEDEWVALEPKPRIVGYGTKINIRTLETPGGTIEYWRAVNVYASTYSPCHSGGDKCYPNTSSGKPVQKGMIAVTLPWYRFMQGLPAYVPNYGYGTIEDVGGGLPDRYWIDLGYSDEDWVGWGGWTTIYFLTPVPATVMWILE